MKCRAGSLASPPNRPCNSPLWPLPVYESVETRIAIVESATTNYFSSPGFALLNGKQSRFSAVPLDLSARTGWFHYAII